MTFFKRLLKNEDGATAIEYGLIAALVSVAAIGAMQALSSSLVDTFTAVSTALASGVSGGQN
jgi:pilus assembly protein Flp/PilA